jgi:fluoride exporter
MDIFWTVALIGLLGGIGSSVRHLVSSWGGFIPWGTLAVNIVGALVAGFAIGSGFYAIALVFGLAGGLSTFSTFAAQSYDLVQQGEKVRALINAVLNLVVPALAFLTVSGIF